MNIWVADFTTVWFGRVKAAAARWNVALASRGITLYYEGSLLGSCPPAGTRSSDTVIAVYDGCPQIGGHFGDGEYFTNGTWSGGLVRLERAPPEGEAGIAVVAHELGHALMLGHQPAGADSVMTEFPVLAWPSASDGAAALPGYPLPDPSPVSPPQKQKQKHHHKRHHR